MKRNVSTAIVTGPIAAALVIIGVAGCGTTSGTKAGPATLAATTAKATTPATPTPAQARTNTPSPVAATPPGASLQPIMMALPAGPSGAAPTPVEFDGNSTNLTGMKGGVAVLLVNNTDVSLICRMVRNDGGGTLDSAPIAAEKSAPAALKSGDYTFIWLLDGVEVARETKTVEATAKYGRVGVGAFHAISSIGKPR